MAVPGEVAGLAEAHRYFGRYFSYLKFSRLLILHQLVVDVVTFRYNKTGQISDRLA